MKANAFHKPDKVEMPKDIAFSLVYTVTKAICEERVACKTLSFLNEKAKREGIG